MQFVEINDSIRRAISYNSDLKMVVRGLDISMMAADKNSMYYQSYPEYLYDSNVLNDVHYLLNKEICFGEVKALVLSPTVSGIETTNFDEYANWNASYEFGAESVLCTYSRPIEIAEQQIDMTNLEKMIIQENIEQNVVSLARANPEIEFYYFYTPYSIVYYDQLKRQGKLNATIDSIQYSTSEILKQKNIKLFSFIDRYEIVTELNNYKDIEHYSEDINDVILSDMKKGRGLLTEKNYVEYFDNVKIFYNNYDYDSLWL